MNWNSSIFNDERSKFDYWPNRDPDTHMEYRPEEIGTLSDYDIDNSTYIPKKSTWFDEDGLITSSLE